jgi:hypothetical protein
MPRLQPGQFWGRAIGAIKIGFAPGFRDDGDAGAGGNAPCANIKNRPVSVSEPTRFRFRSIQSVNNFFWIGKGGARKIAIIRKEM